MKPYYLLVLLALILSAGCSSTSSSRTANYEGLFMEKHESGSPNDTLSFNTTVTTTIDSIAFTTTLTLSEATVETFEIQALMVFGARALFLEGVQMALLDSAIFQMGGQSMPLYIYGGESFETEMGKTRLVHVYSKEMGLIGARFEDIGRGDALCQFNDYQLTDKEFNTLYNDILNAEYSH